MPKFKRVKRNGKDVVVMEYESVVNIDALRANLAEFTRQEQEAAANRRQTEDVLSEVEALAPDLLEESDRRLGLSPMAKKSRQQKRASKRRGAKARKKASRR